MGMYDNFAVSYPLPIESYVPDRYRMFIRSTMDQDNFQSKDLECLLSSYYIDNVGHLYLEDYPPFEDTDFKIKRTKKYFHGHLRIYNSVFLDEEDPKKFLWLEYDLKFTDGLLVCATMISPTKEDFDGLH